MNDTLMLAGGVALLGWIIYKKMPGVAAVVDTIYSTLYQGINLSPDMWKIVNENMVKADITPYGTSDGNHFFMSGLAEYVTNTSTGTLFAIRDNDPVLYIVEGSVPVDRGFTKSDMISGSIEYAKILHVSVSGGA